VYTPVTQNNPPNPYLEDPLRDLQVSEKLLLIPCCFQDDLNL